MFCVICNNLEKAFKARSSEYIEAKSSACYRVSTMFAAFRNVDMERARYELEEHRRVCAFALKAAPRLPQRHTPATLTHLTA